MKAFLIILAFAYSFLATASDFSRVDADISTYENESAKLVAVMDKYPENKLDKTWVIRKIDNMFRIDQLARKTSIELPIKSNYSLEEKNYLNKAMTGYIAKIDRYNTSYIKDLLKIYTWFKISEFDVATDNQAWLLVQHADHDPEFQKQVLLILSSLYKTKETDPSNYAYLFDRVAISSMDPSKETLQRFGTQGVCSGKGKWEPLPMEDPANIDVRRAEVGLGLMSEYIDFMNKFCE